MPQVLYGSKGPSEEQAAVWALSGAKCIEMEVDGIQCHITQLSPSLNYYHVFLGTIELGPITKPLRIGAWYDAAEDLWVLEEVPASIQAA